MRQLWSTLCWLCTKSKCLKVPGYPNLAQVPLYTLLPPPPPQKWKVAFWTDLDFRTSDFQSATPPCKMQSWYFWTDLDFRNFRFSSTTPHLPPPPPYKVGIFGQILTSEFHTFKSATLPFPQYKVGSFGQILTSELQISSAALPPPLLKCKVGIFGQILTSRFQISSATLLPTPSPTNAKAAFLERSKY